MALSGMLHFEKSELLLIELALTPSEVSQGDGGLLPASITSKELCLKIGSALLDALETGTEVDICLTEMECWVLRERVNILASLGTRGDVGLLVKKKLYQALLAYDLEKQVGDIKESEKQERPAKEVRSELASRDGTRSTD